MVRPRIRSDRGPSRIGKTRAIEYVRLMLARQHPKMTTFHAQCEHKPRHADGPFFLNLLEAVGDHSPNSGTNPAKRMRLTARGATVVTGRPVPLIDYDARQTKRGVSVRVKNGRTIFRHAFTATM
jgi:hypothetical protein